MTSAPSGTVTFLFTDIEGSTNLWERWPDAMKAALAQHHALLNAAALEHHGYAFQIVGDAFCVAFGSAPDALGAALTAQRALHAERWGATGLLRVRMALHTGAAQPQDGQYASTRTFNRISRLLSSGYGGQILLTLATEELRCDRDPHIGGYSMRQNRSCPTGLKAIVGRASASLVVVLAALVLAFPSDSRAEVIDNFPSVTFLTALGEPFAPYFAQTFKALPGLATSVAFELEGYLGTENVDFHLLITDVVGSGLDIHPSTVLFESGSVSFSPSAPPTIVSVPLPGLALVPGDTYAFVLDAFVTRDGIDSTVAVGMNGTYADADFLFNQALVGSTRADHFASDWFVGRAIYPTDFTDMAFSMTFVAAVPAPPSLVLLSISVVFLSGRALWRRGIGNLRVKGDSTMA